MSLKGSRPESFILCDRSRGIVYFRVSAREGLDHLAAALALHCAARGQQPQDYEVLAPAPEPIASEIIRRAQALLAAEKATQATVRLMPRPQQVLDGVLNHLQNKEIAAKLNISERTVKFHVSNLLAKFGVHDRVELAERGRRGA